MWQLFGVFNNHYQSAYDWLPNSFKTFLFKSSTAPFPIYVYHRYDDKLENRTKQKRNENRFKVASFKININGMSRWSCIRTTVENRKLCNKRSEKKSYQIEFDREFNLKAEVPDMPSGKWNFVVGTTNSQCDATGWQEVEDYTNLIKSTSHSSSG